ncbi:Quinoprotein amine dehydrogenase, beta chain-like protein [Artemisia annua]|uniref:Quinoprotein amine dehydrogenase, beta chain-like protein n=1 Tax=Artemisia annua TaxID=35608 RepID=A0A2U1KTL1_ARTAN|nr:Quinoprotein amine dehydrogenase, beta chain-like protein [Artemisia annua]
MSRTYNIDDHVVVPFDMSSPEGCLQSITNLREELISSRVGNDVFVKYELLCRRLYLHVQRNDVYNNRFHIDDGPIWFLDSGTGSLREGYLGIGHMYRDLTRRDGVGDVMVGFPRFETAFYDVIRRFTPGGLNVTEERNINRSHWNDLLGNGIASLIVMTLESCRSFWVDFDLGRLITENEYATRRVSGSEGGVMLDWGQMSGISRRVIGNSMPIWRSSPPEVEDVTALEAPIYAWDCVALNFEIIDWLLSEGVECSVANVFLEKAVGRNLTLRESERVRNTRRELLSWYAVFVRYVDAIEKKMRSGNMLFYELQGGGRVLALAAELPLISVPLFCPPPYTNAASDRHQVLANATELYKRMMASSVLPSTPHDTAVDSSSEPMDVTGIIVVQLLEGYEMNDASNLDTSNIPEPKPNLIGPPTDEIRPELLEEELPKGSLLMPETQVLRDLSSTGASTSASQYDENAMVNEPNVEGNSVLSLSQIHPQLSASLTASAAAELPCAVKLKIWPHDFEILMLLSSLHYFVCKALRSD